MIDQKTSIPKDWILTNFGDNNLFQILGSGINYFKGEKEYYSTSSIDKDKLISVEQLITYKERPSRANMQPAKNTVWFAKMKDTLKLIYPNQYQIDNVIFSTGFCGIKTDLVDCSYLMQILKSEDFNSKKDNLAEGTTQVAVNNQKIKNIEFLLPVSILEQRKIASILSKLDESIAQLELLIEKYNRIKIGLMHDLLTCGVDEQGNIRSEETHKFKDSLLGRIPVEWSAVKLGVIINDGGGLIQTGPFGSQLHANEYVEEGVPVIMPQNILQKGIDEKTLSFIQNAKAKILKRHVTNINDIIFARRGDLSKCAVIDSKYQGAICGTGCLLIRIKKADINPFWLRMLYQQFNYQKEINISSVGSTMQNLNTEILSNLLIPKISRAEQNLIVERIQGIDTLIEMSIDNYNKLSKKKPGLMHDLLTGKVRVRI